MIGELLRAFLASFLGTLGFAGMIRVPKRAMLPASLIGAMSFVLYTLLVRLGMSEAFAVFAGALFGSVMGQWCARKMHMIATIFILLAIVPAVPGLGLYRFMEMLGSDRMAEGAAVGVNAMVSIAMIALGIGMGNFLFHLISAACKRKRR